MSAVGLGKAGAGGNGVYEFMLVLRAAKTLSLATFTLDLLGSQNLSRYLER